MVRIKVFKIFDGGSNPPSPAVSELLTSLLLACRRHGGRSRRDLNKGNPSVDFQSDGGT